MPTTFLLTSFYWDNLIFFGMGPKRGPDGELAFTLPMGNKRMASIAAEDIGKVAYATLAGGASSSERRWVSPGSTSPCSDGQRANPGTGPGSAYNEVSPEAYRGFGFPGAEDLGNMFQFFRDFDRDFCAARKLEVGRALNPEMQTFDAWLSKNKQRIPLE